MSSGGDTDAYRQGGYNKYSLRDYLRPFERTAELCKMVYWPPYWVPGVHRMQAGDIKQCGSHYKNLLSALANDLFSSEDILSLPLINHLIPQPQTR